MVADKSPWPPTTGSRRRLSELSSVLVGSTGHLLLVGDIGPSEKTALESALPGAHTTVSGTNLATVRRAMERAAEQVSCNVLFASGPWIARVFTSEPLLPLAVDAPSLTIKLIRNELVTNLRQIHQRVARRRFLAQSLGAPNQVFLERRAWHMANLVTPCSPFEQAKLPSDIRFKSAVVPNGCVPGPEPSLLRRPPRLIFVGTLYYQPNVEAASLLANRVLPEARQRFPDLQLDIVGASPLRVRDRLAAVPGVQVHGFVDDLGPLYSQATHTVIPLRRNTGTNVKLLEAMASGIPVIAYPPAISGLPALRPGRDLLVATGWRHAVDQLTELILDRQRSHSLAFSAWKTVIDHYSWERSREFLFSALIDLSNGQ